MSKPVRSSVDADHQVTASDLVRHFGLWQERATRAPVYVLHRGRPRLVLTSLDIMDALCAPHAAAEPDDGDALDTLLDADEGLTIVVDSAGTVVHASRGARIRLGDTVRKAVAIAHFAIAGGDLLADAIARVSNSGMPEAVEIAPARYPSRRLLCRVEPFRTGCIVRAHDVSADEEARAAQEGLAATIAAAEATGACLVRITPRGHLAAPSPGLARLTGVASESLATARFTSLIDVADRVRVGDAIERAFAEGGRSHVAAHLLVRGAASVPVTIGLAPLREEGRIAALVAAIAAAPA